MATLATSLVHGIAARLPPTTAFDTTCTMPHQIGMRPTSPPIVASAASYAVPVAVPSTVAGSVPAPIRRSTAQSELRAHVAHLTELHLREGHRRDEQHDHRHHDVRFALLQALDRRRALVVAALARLHDVVQEDHHERHVDQAGVVQHGPEAVVHHPAEQDRQELEVTGDAHRPIPAAACRRTPPPAGAASRARPRGTGASPPAGTASRPAT